MGAAGGSTLHTVLGVSGNIITITFFMTSTLKPVWQMVKKKGGGGILMSPWTNQLYLFMLFNCLLWVFYGLPFNRPHNFWVILTNAIGAFLALIAVIAYHHYASQSQRLIVQWEIEIFVSLFTIMALLVLAVNKSRHTRVFVVGTVSAVFSSCMHLALLSELAMAWKNKDMKLLHPVPSIAAFIKGALWTAYGWNAKDPFIVVPNAIGVATGLIQVILCVVIRYNIQGITAQKTLADDPLATHSQELAVSEVKLNNNPQWNIWVVSDWNLDSIRPSNFTRCF